MTFGLYLLLNIVLMLFLALWLRRLVVRRLEPERILNDLSTEIRDLVAELNQTSDHNISLLEDRIDQLRALVSDADQQIDELTRALTAAKESRTAPRHTPAEERLAEQRGHDEDVLTFSFGTPTTHDTDTHDMDTPVTDTLVANTPVDVPSTNSTAGDRDRSNDRSDERRNGAREQSDRLAREAVWDLHGQGLSAELIANRTGMAIGEVELIISLGERRAGR